MEIVVPDEYQYLYVQNAERPVVKIPAPILRQRADPIKKISKNTQNIADNMKRILRMSNGVGLAGPQIGLSERIIVVHPVGMKATVMINPEIITLEGEQIGEEGCLSIPGLYGDVKRALRCVVKAYDLKGRQYEYDLEEMPARIAQHEIDHLDGVLFIDKVDLGTLHWMHPAGSNDPAE